MRRLLLFLTLVGALLLACTGVVLAQQTSPPGGGQQSAPGQSVRVCPGPASQGTARCHARLRTDIGGGKSHAGPSSGGETTQETTAGPSTQPGGETTGQASKANPNASASTGPWGAWDLQAAYNLPVTCSNAYVSCPSGSTAPSPGMGPTVAVVDAYHDPNAENDLNGLTGKGPYYGYRSYYGLGQCTIANGCFKQVNQNGKQGSYPKTNGAWAQEISLDLNMVSAICPNCKILLVEANSNSFSDLAAAVDTAASLGATAISNSYGSSEFSGETSYESHYNQWAKGSAVTVSSGDSGYGVEYPAASQYVTAVGGTTLKKDSSTGGWTETAWSGAGSGCSAYIPQQSWQKKLNLSGCAQRMVADVSAVADPATAVWVYDSLKYQGASGWMAFGGTSVAAPIIAAMYALAGNVATVPIKDGSYPYSNPSALYDVTSGSNGSCDSSYLCSALAGYDGPTGLGTPGKKDAYKQAF